MRRKSEGGMIRKKVKLWALSILRLTADVNVSVGQGKQWRVEWVMTVTQDWVPLVDLLHHL